MSDLRTLFTDPDQFFAQQAQQQPQQQEQTNPWDQLAQRSGGILPSSQQMGAMARAGDGFRDAASFLDQEIGEFARGRGPRDLHEAEIRFNERYPNMDFSTFRPHVDAIRREVEPAARFNRYMEQARAGEFDTSLADEIASRLPFVGSIHSLGNAVSVRNSALAIANGRADNRDYQRVTGFLAEAERAGNRGLWSSVANIVSHLPAFAIEFGTTAGAFTGARVAGTRAATSVLTRVVGQTAAASTAGRLATGSAGYLAGAVGQTAAMPQRIAEDAARRSVPTFSQEGGRLNINDPGNIVQNLPAGALDTLIEVGSERAGEALPIIARQFGRLPGVGRAASAWAGSAPGRTIAAWEGGAQRLASRLGYDAYHGVAGEMFEERVGEVLRGITRLSTNPDGSPDYGTVGDILSGRGGRAGQQLLSEAIAFAIIPAGAAGINRLTTTSQQRSAQRAMAWMEGNGLSEEDRNAGFESTHNLVRSLIPLGREAAREAIREQMGEEGPLLDYALALAENIPTAPTVPSAQQVTPAEAEQLPAQGPSPGLDPEIGSRSNLPEVQQNEPAPQPVPQPEVNKSLLNEVRGTRIAAEDAAQAARRVESTQDAPVQAPVAPSTSTPVQNAQVATPTPQSAVNVKPASPTIESPWIAKIRAKQPEKPTPIGRQYVSSRSQPEKLQSIYERMLDGEKPTFEEISQAAGWSGQQAEVIEARTAEGLTLDEIADRLDLTRERVRQIEAKALEKAGSVAKSIAKSIHAQDEARAKAASAAQVDQSELSTTADQAADMPKIQAPLTSLDIEQKSLDQIAQEMVDAAEKGELTPEQYAEFKAKAEAEEEKYLQSTRESERAANRAGKTKRRIKERRERSEKVGVLEADKRATERSGKEASEVPELARSPKGPTPAPGITGGLTQRKGEAPKVPISNHTITATIYKLFDLPYFPDRARRKAQAVYAWLQENVWFNKDYAGFIGTALHEATHHIDKTNEVIENASAQVKQDLGVLDYEDNRENRKLAAREGFAELVRRWITEDAPPDEQKDAYNRLVPWLESWLEANPEVKAKFDRIKPLIDQFRQQTPAQRVQANVVGKQEAAKALQTSGEKLGEELGSAWSNLLYKWVGEGEYLKKLQEAIEKQRGVKFERGSGPYGQYLATARMGPAYVYNSFKNGAIALSTFQPVDGAISLESVLEGIKVEELEQAVAYAYAAHAIDAWAKTRIDSKTKKEVAAPVNPGISLEDATAAEEQLRNPRYIQFAQRLTAYNNQGLEVAVDAGLISREEADTYKEEWETYLPLFRVRPKGSLARSLAGTKYVDVGKFYKRRTGGDYQVLNPLESSVAKMQLLYARAVRQSIINEIDRYTNPKSPDFVEGLAAWVTQEPPGMTKTAVPIQEIAPEVIKVLTEAGVIDQDALEELEEIPAGIINIYRPDYNNKSDQPIVRVLRNGEPAMIRLDPNLHSFLTGLEQANYSGFWAVTGAATRFFKMMTTGINPGFAAANFIKDWQAAFFQSKEQGLASRIAGPPVQLARDLVGFFIGATTSGKRGEAHLKELFEMMGGKDVNRRGYDLPAQKKSIKEVMESGALSKAYRIIKHPLKALEAVVSYGESVPRFLEFKAALARHGFTEQDLIDGKKPTAEALRSAQVAAAEVTVNFNETGLYTKQINQIIPYFSAHVRGLTRTVQYYREGLKTENLPRTIMDHSIYLGLITAAWWMVKDDDWWQEADDWLKYGFITFPGSKGQPAFRVPLVHGQGTLVAANWLGILESIRTESFKPMGSSALAAMGDVFTASRMGPVGILPLTEVALNHSFYTGRTLEPSRMGRIQPGSRTIPETTAPAKLLGQLAPEWISPIRVDHFLNSMTGRLYGSAMNLEWAGLIGYGRFTLRSDHPRTMNEFYRELERVEQLRNTHMIDSVQGTRTPAQQREALGRVPRELADRYHVLEWTSRLMSDLRAPIRNERDRDERFQVEKFAIGLARSVMGEQQLGRYPSPLRSSSLESMPADIREVVMRHLQPQVMSLSSPRPELPRVPTPQQRQEFPQRIQDWQQRRHDAQQILRLTDLTPAQLQGMIARQRTQSGGQMNRATVDRMRRVGQQ